MMLGVGVLLETMVDFSMCVCVVFFRGAKIVLRNTASMVLVGEVLGFTWIFGWRDNFQLNCI